MFKTFLTMREMAANPKKMHRQNRSTFPHSYPLVVKNPKTDFHFDDIRLRYHQICPILV